MKTIIFDDEITPESISNLIQEIEFIPDNEQGFQLEDGRIIYERTIYFSSGGGSTEHALVFTDWLNNNQQFAINLLGYWNISSSAFNIFTMANCNKRLIGGNAFSIVHLMDRESSNRELKKKKSIDKFLIEQMDKQNEVLLEWYQKIGITEEQIKEIKAGEDVTIARDQLEQIVDFTIKQFEESIKVVEQKPKKKKKPKKSLDKK